MYSHTPHFRSDIEGMRAIAILMVIGAHFSIPGLAAGFIGVDIFFVLSGFLITGILVREYNQNQRLDLPRFYANRLRRLFPALATMLVLSSLAAAYILPATQHIAHSKAAVMAALWLSNIHFTFADVDYFAAETSSNAFVHTWSLGVEEQFYLLWPLLILSALVLPASKGRTRPLWIMLAGIAILSLLACLHVAKTHPIFAFYMMPTRAWQFAAGGMVWLLSQQHITTSISARSGSLVAVLLLLPAMLLIGPNTTYPGLLALLPTLATCALLWTGHCKQSPSHKVLSVPLMQWIGRVSYSWYLWHWPVLILGEYLMPIRGHFPNTLGAIALSLLLAVITHHVIENPIRFGKIKQARPRWQIGATLAAMALITSQLLRWHTDTEDLFSSAPTAASITQERIDSKRKLFSKPENIRYVQAMSELPSFYQDGCDSWYQNDELKPCRYGNPDATKTAVLLGDSVGAQWFPTLTELYNPDEWSLVVLTKSACPIIDEPYFYQRIGREYTECSRWRNKAIAWIIEKRPDALFIGSTASYPFTEEQIEMGSNKILSKLSPVLSDIYIIEPSPLLGFSGPACLMQNKNESKEKCTSHMLSNKSYSQASRILESLTKNYENIHWLETASFICPDGFCSAERNGMIV
ncbi:MAG: acyltransferase family protein, partial [Rhodocyclaceae bacterium]|nr:acyltransferase family protein [Rhodocyclaceae bacterium]